MSVDSTKLIVPGHGTVFHAARGVALPTNPLAAFSLTGAAPAGWTNLGHTSKANTLAFTKEGGEKESLDTFLADAVRYSYSGVSWGMTIPALQFDEDVLDMAFNGDIDPTTGGYIVPGQVDPIETQLFTLLHDNTGKLGFWIENVDVTLGEAPTTDPAAFLELPLSAAFKAADDTKIPAVGGKPGLFEIFHSSTTSSVPTLSSATPTAGEAGNLITIKGSGFNTVTGVAGVKVGGVNASSYAIVNDTTIVATVPAGSAGSAPIVVTSPSGASAPLPYTRGA